jgi:intracellular sulfur oxidation DsrE/DsrF family protein
MGKLKLLCIVLLLGTGYTASSQEKIVWEISSGDTAQQRILFRQINNVLTAAPDTKIEVVFHGFAIFAVLKDTGYFKEQIVQAHKKGVVIAACNNSLKNRNISKDRVIPEATIVPVSILEIAAKQREGWSYIKAE